MDLRATEDVASRFVEYVEHLSEVIGHADRRGPLASYCSGLLLPGERKSVEPMAARLAPDAVGAKHQSLHHFVAKAPWDEAELLAAMRSFVLPKIEARAPIRAWIVDDTGIPKKASIRSGLRASTAASFTARDVHRATLLPIVRMPRPTRPIPRLTPRGIRPTPRATFRQTEGDRKGRSWDRDRADRKGRS
jgi:hypothetical protein